LAILPTGLWCKRSYTLHVLDLLCLTSITIVQYIGSVEEAEWAIEVLKQKNVPIAVTLSISPLGDFNNVPVEECGRRLAQAGRFTRSWVHFL